MKTNIIFIGNSSSSELTSLRAVIDRELVIPSYQRPYAWNEDNIEDLFNTIKESFEAEEQKDASEKDNSHPAFFGSVIFSSQDQKKYLIIDGQQRITAFLLVLRVIQEKLEQDKSQRLADLEKLEQNASEAQNKFDRKRYKEITERSREKEDQNRDCDKLIQKIKNILNKTNITRESPVSNSKEAKTDSKEAKAENEYINYITRRKHFKESKDFKKNKDKISDLIDKIIGDIPSKFSDEYEKFQHIADYILDTVKFCLLNIEGANSEEYAIDVFNTLNSTGEPLTGFETLKSKMTQIGKQIEKEKEIETAFIKIENSIKEQRPNRKDIIVQTGKLLLYLAVHRDDFKTGKLSDKKFKDQNAYIKQALNENNALGMLEDLQKLCAFVVENWLPKKSSDRSYYKLLSSKKAVFAQKGFDFLNDIKHDRVIPVIYKWSENRWAKDFRAEKYQKTVELSVSFSCLWRMAFDGGASGIDAEYLAIAKKAKNERDSEKLQSIIKSQFLNKFSNKEVWLNNIQKSNINKNKSITKFLLALISLKDISDYNSSAWISWPVSKNKSFLHYLGNIILIPKNQKKDFENDWQASLSKLLKKEGFNSDIYNGISEDADIKQIDKRTLKLGKLLWNKLAQEVLGL